MKNVRKRAESCLWFFWLHLVILYRCTQDIRAGGAVYSSMDESRLPVVYTEFEGKEINGLHGYVQDSGESMKPEKRFLFCLQTED